jgi:hypothetical protein
VLEVWESSPRPGGLLMGGGEAGEGQGAFMAGIER